MSTSRIARITTMAATVPPRHLVTVLRLPSWRPSPVALAEYDWSPMGPPDASRVVVVTADEDDRHAGDNVLTSVLSTHLSHRVARTPLTHCSLARYLAE